LQEPTNKNYNLTKQMAISVLLFAVFLFCFVEFMLRCQSGIFREWERAFLSFQWLLTVCLAIWCGNFLIFTFKLHDLPLIGLLLIASIAYLAGYAARPAIDAPNFLMGVTLGKGASWAFKSERKMQNTEVQDALNLCHPPSAILNFPGGVLGLLVCATCWHLDMSGNFYHGPRWMGLWDNPNTYGMLMAAGFTLAIGLFAARAKNGMWKKRKLLEGRKAESEKSGNFFLRTMSFFEAIKSAIGHWQSAFLLVAVFMLGVGLVMSYSRGAWLATGLALLYLAWCYGKLKWRYIVIGSSVLVLGAGVLCGRTPDSAPWYVKRADLGRPSAQHRVIAWRAGLEIMRDHPLGVGWNKAMETYQKDYSPPEGGPGAITTNDYLMIGTELGIPALVCFVAYVALCFRKSPRLHLTMSSKMEKPTPHPEPLPIGSADSADAEREKHITHHESLRAACLAGALVFVVAFWFDGGLFKLPTAALFWVLLELGAARDGGVDCKELFVVRKKTL
jgi:O-antigen ligase